MINHTYKTKKRAYRGIFGAFLILFLLTGLFFYNLRPAQAQDWYNYYNVEAFYGDPADNSAIMRIYVKTSFNIRYQRLSEQVFCYPFKSARVAGALFNIFEGGNDVWGVIDPFTIEENGVNLYYGTSFCWDATAYYAQFQAGKTYEFKFTKNKSTHYTDLLGVWARQYYDSNSKGWFYLEMNDAVCDLFYDYPANPALYNPSCYLYKIAPTLEITYPMDNAEIAEAFNIQGTYDVKDLELYNLLVARLKYQDASYYYFSQDLTTATGTIDLRVSGIPKGDYEIEFLFTGGTAGAFLIDKLINIILVSSIPFELPTGETTPEYFSLYSADYIYSLYSNYTTPTALFNALSGAIEPIIKTLGDNLTFFSTQFDQNTAKKTGQDTGEAVLIIRAYAGNLNSFFNDLPISEVLFFYLLLLIVVAIFRIIRQVIKLIPFI